MRTPGECATERKGNYVKRGFSNMGLASGVARWRRRVSDAPDPRLGEAALQVECVVIIVRISVMDMEWRERERDGKLLSK